MSLSTVIKYGLLSQDIFPLSGLLSYWRMDETTGSVVKDYGVNNYSGDCTNITFDSGGKNNYCAKSTATNSRIALQNTAYYEFERTDTWTFAFWDKCTTANTSRLMISKEADKGGGFRGYCLQGGSGGYIYYDLTNTYPSRRCDGWGYSPAITGTTWNHVVWTYNGNGVCSGNLIYVNGILATMTANRNTLGANTITGSGKLFTIGNRGTESVNVANHYQDEVGVWNRVLSQAEVTALYNAGNGIYY